MPISGIVWENQNNSREPSQVPLEEPTYVLMVICETTKQNYYFQSLRRISLQNGNQIAAKSQLKQQENRKCKRPLQLLLFESDISHTKMHCSTLCKCITVVDGHTRCLGACCMSQTCYRFTHRNLFQITNLGRWCPQTEFHTAGSKIFLPFMIMTGPQITNFCFVVSFRKLP